MDRKLCMWIVASSNSGYSVVNDELFLEWCRSINLVYKVSCFCTVKRNIANNIRMKVVDVIKVAERVTLCLDLWTADDGTHILGVIAHLYCKERKRAIRIVVGCKEIETKASASNVAILVQDIWQKDFGCDLGAYRIRITSSTAE